MPQVRQCTAAAGTRSRGAGGLVARGGSGLPDPERLDPGRRRRRAPGHGVDLRRALEVRVLEHAPLRRVGARPVGCRRRHGQLPGGLRGVRASARRPRQPRAPGPGGRAGMGAVEHLRVRRGPRQRHRVRPVGRGRLDRAVAVGAVRERPVPAGHRAERSRRAPHGRRRRGRHGVDRPCRRSSGDLGGVRRAAARGDPRRAGGPVPGTRRRLRRVRAGARRRPGDRPAGGGDRVRGRPGRRPGHGIHARGIPRPGPPATARGRPRRGRPRVRATPGGRPGLPRLLSGPA